MHLFERAVGAFEKISVIVRLQTVHPEDGSVFSPSERAFRIKCGLESDNRTARG